MPPQGAKPNNKWPGQQFAMAAPTTIARPGTMAKSTSWKQWKPSLTNQKNTQYRENQGTILSVKETEVPLRSVSLTVASGFLVARIRHLSSHGNSNNTRTKAHGGKNRHPSNTKPHARSNKRIRRSMKKTEWTSASNTFRTIPSCPSLKFPNHWSPGSGRLSFPIWKSRDWQDKIRKLLGAPSYCCHPVPSQFCHMGYPTAKREASC